MTKPYAQPCPVAAALDLIGERWVLLIVRDLLSGAQRFADLEASLRSIAPNVLSDRLKKMEDAGLVERHFYSEHPPRAQYRLTQAGQEASTVLAALASWGARRANAGAALVHSSCGTPIEMHVYCPHCEQDVGTDARIMPMNPSGSKDTAGVLVDEADT